jgi:hypothetical protein
MLAAAVHAVPDRQVLHGRADRDHPADIAVAGIERVVHPLRPPSIRIEIAGKAKALRAAADVGDDALDLDLIGWGGGARQARRLGRRRGARETRRWRFS